jgi:hypothetical protein
LEATAGEQPKKQGLQRPSFALKNYTQKYNSRGKEKVPDRYKKEQGTFR